MPGCGSGTGAMLRSKDSDSAKPAALEVRAPEKSSTSFATLPGEIRNMIYELLLIADGPVQIRYFASAHGDIEFRVKNSLGAAETELDKATPREGYKRISRAQARLMPNTQGSEPGSRQKSERGVTGYEACRALGAFSLLNRHIRREARLLFFANNGIEFRVDRSSGRLFGPTIRAFKDQAYIQACSSFLEHIGAGGRSLITSLKLNDARPHGDVRFDPGYNNEYDVANLFRLLHQCTNLTTLDTNNLCILAPKSVKESKLLRGADVQGFADRFNTFPALTVLKLSCQRYEIGNPFYRLNFKTVFLATELCRLMDVEIIGEVLGDRTVFTSLSVFQGVRGSVMLGEPFVYRLE